MYFALGLKLELLIQLTNAYLSLKCIFSLPFSLSYVRIQITAHSKKNSNLIINFKKVMSFIFLNSFLNLFHIIKRLICIVATYSSPSNKAKGRLAYETLIYFPFCNKFHCPFLLTILFYKSVRKINESSTDMDLNVKTYFKMATIYTLFPLRSNYRLK